MLRAAVGVYVVGSLDPAQIMPWTTCCHQAMGRKTFPYHRGRAEFLLLVTGREHQVFFHHSCLSVSVLQTLDLQEIRSRPYFQISVYDLSWLNFCRILFLTFCSFNEQVSDTLSVSCI